MQRRTLLGLLPLGLAGCVDLDGPPGGGLQFIRLPAFVVDSYKANAKQIADATARATEIETAMAEPDAKIQPAEKTKIIVVEIDPREEPAKPEPAEPNPEPEPADKPATKTVVLWNTEFDQIVGNKAYEIDRAPAPGKVLKWGSEVVQYVGSKDAL